ncbi:MAG: TIGR02652 family protein [Leptolyngbya sp. SIO3F4]|nr:TIGR02652 family protein [Leptolyngbya sp. SIO3F4]
MSPGSLLPPLGETICCPCCHRSIPALVLTDAYLCPRHGLFEVGSEKNEVIHLDTGRRWRSWQGQWYRQHQQIESLRREMFAALAHLHHQGFHATGITLAQRYRELVTPYLESGSDWFRQIYCGKLRLYGLPVTFQSETQADSRWHVISFELTKVPGPPKTYTYLTCTRISESRRKFG